jgi:uncharacterized membrane protein
MDRKIHKLWNTISIWIGNRYHKVVKSICLLSCYGFRELMEVAVKAVRLWNQRSRHCNRKYPALSRLFVFRVANFPDGVVKNDRNKTIIIKTELSFNDMFKICILPIWDYEKNDRMIQQELFQILNYLRSISKTTVINKLYQDVSLAIENNER